MLLLRSVSPQIAGLSKSRPTAFLALAVMGFLLLPFARVHAQGDEGSPFKVTPTLTTGNGASALTLTFRVPEHHHIYADRLSFEMNGTPVSVSLPEAKIVADKFSKQDRKTFEKDFQVAWPLPDSRSSNLLVAVTFQGCGERECYFPETHQWRVGADNTIAGLDDSDAAATDSAGGGLTKGFRVTARASGFLGAEKFLSFLDQSSGTAPATADLSANASRIGLLATVGLILLGGLALNLTPCVLPMIPINLAILGVGARNQNRRRGFLLGSTYGAGMAFAYGLLGLVVVLTGSKFGTLNSSSWFNFAIAIVFVVLGLAMFDKLAIDFSRFQRGGGKSKTSGGGAFLAAGAMGSFSALLAGACVAPVVISVLLLATTFYQKGNLLGLLLPFVLGLGMAIPWPFAAAGLSFLPKPGAWMTRVKYGFGVIIFAFAAWYGWLGWTLSGFGSSAGMLVAARSNSLPELRSALDQSRATGKPVVVDFWAGWCKNCEAMEHATFRDANVRARLAKDFIVVKFQAERLNDAALKPVLDEFGVMGLPTYVVLRPDAVRAGATPISDTAKD